MKIDLEVMDLLSELQELIEQAPLKGLTKKSVNLDKEEVNPNKENENKSPSSNDMLIEINKDYKSWITIFDTHIDYPVVQGKNNMEYINKNFYGEYSISGIPFLDYRNSEYFQDNYNLLYGHHMQNDAMFSDVINFLNEDYFNNHLMGELYSLDNEYDIYCKDLYIR